MTSAGGGIGHGKCNTIMLCQPARIELGMYQKKEQHMCRLEMLKCDHRSLSAEDLDSVKMFRHIFHLKAQVLVVRPASANWAMIRWRRRGVLRFSALATNRVVATVG